MENHAEERADEGARHFAGGDVVDSDVAGVGVIETHEKVDNCGFSGTGWADNGDFFARGDFGGEVFDDGSFFIVREADVMKFDSSFDVGDGFGGNGVGGFFGFGKESENAFSGGEGLLDGGDDLR